MKTYQQFDESDWRRTAHNWTAWWRGELDRPIVVIETLAQPGATAPTSFTFSTLADHIARFGLATPAETVIDYFAPQLDALHLFADAFPKWWPNFGPGALAAFLGSPVDASAGTTWFHPAGLHSLAQTELTFTLDNPWWRRVEAVTQAAVKRWGDRVLLGHIDLGGNLDVLASLRGAQALLLDLYDAPDDVERLVGQITRLWLRYYDAFQQLIAATHRGAACWGPLWAPGSGYMLQSDFSYMISPAMAERLVLPDLLACCDALDYAFYHLDGKGEIKHLDMLLSIERLRGIQWVPGAGAPPAQEWLPLLKRIRDGGKLCQVYVTLDGALKIARELGGEGFAFYIVADLTLDGPLFTLDQAQACCDALAAADLLT